MELIRGVTLGSVRKLSPSPSTPPPFSPPHHPSPSPPPPLPQHETFQLRGIHPCDISDEDLAERRKARKRAREQQRRKGKGPSHAPHIWPASPTPSKAKPWVQLGMSKASYYRKKKT